MPASRRPNMGFELDLVDHVDAEVHVHNSSRRMYWNARGAGHLVATPMDKIGEGSEENTFQYAVGDQVLQQGLVRVHGASCEADR